MTLFFTSFGRAGLLLAAVAFAAPGAAQGLPEGGNAAAPGEGVVAVVAGEPITAEAFEREMALRGGNIPGQYATLEQRRALLDEMVRFRALVARARELGYDSDPDVVAVLERTMVTKLQHKELDRQLEAVTVSDEEVAAHWAAHRDQYARPARYKGAIVFIAVSMMASEEKRAELERRAEQALEEARALGPETLHFGPVARKYSDDRASRYQGGVIG
ncbi:MAG: peptidylprolyl isomerase, partial [Deltaproteobacteria bacterium]|nr:peptidylprolyl isomerase [Deltaproteobacteria bacterium]